MKLLKAIEIVTLMEKTLAPMIVGEGTDALKLLIEAGKRLEALRRNLFFARHPLLPDETDPTDSP